MTTTPKRRARRGIAIALASMLLAAPAAQARLDEGGSGTAGRGPAPVLPAERDGFSWTDAGLGAGAAVAALALAGAAGHVARRRSLPAHS